jgi:putative Mn2+ efflux pump MntP
MKHSKDTGSNKKSETTQWLSYTNMGLELLIMIFIGKWLGGKIDAYYQIQDKWFEMGGMILFIFLSTYRLIKKLNEIQK